MGFFKNMISGGAGVAGANNAHLAEMSLKSFSPQDKFRVLERMIKMYKRAGGIAAAPELIIRRFNEANSRVAQLNIIALALADLGYPSPVSGESWMAVQNPFSLEVDESDLDVIAGHMRRKHEVHIALPKSKIDFNLWIVEPRGNSGNNRITQEVDNDRLWKEAQKKAEEQSTTRSSGTVGLALSDDDLLGYMQAISASANGDYATALGFYRPLAEQGHAASQVALAMLYALGRGVQQDYAEAAKWYRKAAEQGRKHAQYDLGRMYALGQGVRQDYAEAAKWVRKAAEQGEADAQYNLGRMCAEGNGVPQDYSEALKWYHKAAEQGQADAQYSLGRMYALGDGVPQDYMLAHKWLSLAATYWDASDEAGRNVVIKQRDHIATLMSREQIVTAQHLAREWKSTAPP